MRYIKSGGLVALCCIAAFIAVSVSHLMGVTFFYYHLLLHAHHGVQMYYGVLCFFTALLALELSIFSLTKTKRGLSFIIVGMMIGYLSFGLSSLTYGFLFESAREMNTLQHIPIIGFIEHEFIIIPAIAGAWIMGPVANWLFVIMEKRFLSKLSSQPG